MGTTYVDVTIRNPADPQRSWTGKFVVDTGAFDSLVPRGRLEAIGLKPRGSRDYVLAKYGEEGVEPLLGLTALESGGFEIDPRGERLKRLPGVRL